MQNAVFFGYFHLPVPTDQVQGTEPLQSSQCVQRHVDTWQLGDRCPSWSLHKFVIIDTKSCGAIPLHHQLNWQSPRLLDCQIFLLHFFQQLLYLLLKEWGYLTNGLSDGHSVSGGNFMANHKDILSLSPMSFPLFPKASPASLVTQMSFPLA